MGAKFGIGVAVILGLTVMAAAAPPKPVKPTNTWRGSVADEKLAKEMPEDGVITNAKDFEKLVKAWKVADKVPEVNFEKELVLVAHTPGSRISLNPVLDDKGNLTVITLATQDLGTGFRYIMISVPRQGVKTVNGKELPK
ncbi:MAG: hypothetical protein RMJ52_13320 [Gemmataceae bacterium]|nr:hypothetical protein [Gemmataceae bacterium]